MKCKFCEKQTVEADGFWVCNECHTVSFLKDITAEERKNFVLDYLKNIQYKVLKQQDFLHAIEQKCILKEKLTPTEQEIRKNIDEFQSIRLELETYINNGSELYQKNERNLLYRLLILSEWLSKYFRRND